MKLLVVRHGRTDWNDLGKVQGLADIKLNKEGINQAYQTKEKLKDYDIDLIISSPLTRTRQTAEIINEGRNIKTIYDDRIIERDYGEYEGYQKHEFEYLDYWRYEKNVKYKKAENIQDFYKRIYAFIDDAKQRYNDKTVLLVIHGGISVAINAYFFGIPSEENPTYGSLKNCEVKVFDL